jgi:hypothetical protein
MEKSMVRILPQTLGIYSLDFFATHEEKGKRVKGFNALVYSSNIMAMNDHRSSYWISSFDRYLSLHCHFSISRGSFFLAQGY